MATSESISIRPFADSDAQAVREVAQRDSSIVPAGVLLVAELDGEVRAALSLDTGEVVADPFAPSTALVDLLRTRALQLTGHRPPRRRRRGLLDRRTAGDAVRTPAAI
ncbi:MAG: hypothetical protein ACRDLQ_09140 [Solirubrobacterales bacterium]